MKATRFEKYLPPPPFYSPPPPPLFPPVVSDLSQSLTLPSSPLHLQSPPYPSFSLHRPLCVPFPSAPSHSPLSLPLQFPPYSPPLPSPQSLSVPILLSCFHPLSLSFFKGSLPTRSPHFSLSSAPICNLPPLLLSPSLSLSLPLRFPP